MYKIIVELIKEDEKADPLRSNTLVRDYEIDIENEKIAEKVFERLTHSAEYMKNKEKS